MHSLPPGIEEMTELISKQNHGIIFLGLRQTFNHLNMQINMNNICQFSVRTALSTHSSSVTKPVKFIVKLLCEKQCFFFWKE